MGTDRSRSATLDWPKRVQIITGIARGLLYLHHDSRLRIIHRDLKPSDILLDEEMNPKISDFGLARMFGGNQIQASTNMVVGTCGYMAPEYAMKGLFSVKSDVFSFGVLLLQVVTGKRNIISLNLLGHVWRLWNEEETLQLADPCIRELCLVELTRYVHVGLLCVQEKADDRPTMPSVVVMLGSETAALPPPKQPAFCYEANANANDSDSSSNRAMKDGSINEISITMLEGR